MEIFEEMGFRYIGPVDGHNIEELIENINKAKELGGPILIHVKTVKGKGYEFAEKNPADYHGVSPFDLSTGKAVKKSLLPSYSAVFGKTLEKLAENNGVVASEGENFANSEATFFFIR